MNTYAWGCTMDRTTWTRIACVSLVAAGGCADTGGAPGSEPVGLVAAALATDDLGEVESANEMARMAQYVADLYRPGDVLHQYASASGDVVDCIDEARQLPVRRGTGRIESPPDFLPEVGPDNLGVARMAESGYDSEGRERRCPPGTVAEPHIDLDALKRFKNLNQLLGRGAKVGQAPTGTTNGGSAPAQSGHEYATVLHRKTGKYGITGHIQLWNPPEVVGANGGFGSSGDFSLMQIWAGANPGLSTHESVEAGFIRYKSFSKSALFVYFDPDNYGNGGETSGCWNSLCPNSFTKYSWATYTPGLTFADNQYSVAGGQQKGLQITLYKNGTNGHWYLGIEGQWVGYWTKSSFDSTGIGNTASALDWGGEITGVLSPHTTTDMGSGAYATSGWTWSAGIWNMAIYDTASSLNTSPEVTGTSQVDYCYTLAENTSAGGWGRAYYLGGPGRWSIFGITICP